jgi:hypothetical protein
VYFLRDSTGTLTTNDLWIMAGINLALGAGCVALFGSMIKEKVRPLKQAPPAMLATGATIGEAT